MPPPLDVKKRALDEAKRGHSFAYNPFRRIDLGRVHSREAYLHAVVRVLSGDTYDFFEPMPGEPESDTKNGAGRGRPGRIEVNHAYEWLNTLAATYSTAPTRTFFVDGAPVDPAEDPVIQAVVTAYGDSEIDRVLELVDFWLLAVGNVVARPLWDEDHGELVVHLYRSPQVRIVANDINPRRPWATILSGFTQSAPEGAVILGQQLTRQEIFLPGEFIGLEGGREVESANVAPPLVHCFNQYPTNLRGYWTPCVGPALVHIDRIINNDLLGTMGYNVVMQGFSQAVAYGLDPTQAVTLGPGRVLSFSGSPDRKEGLEYVAPNAPMLDASEVIDRMLSYVRRAHGIPDALLSANTDASGAAIVQANAPLAEYRSRRGKVFSRIERDMLRAAIAVMAGRADGVPAGIDPMRYDVSASFETPAGSLTVADKIARQKHLLELGVLTIGDIAVAEMPGKWTSAEEAEAALEEREQAKLQEPKPAPTFGAPKVDQLPDKESDESENPLDGEPSEG